MGIPKGKVSTYGRLAEKSGASKGARAVGNALATNPYPLIIPCHRVIRSDGSLGGFGGGLKMKKELLLMEGITFDAKGRSWQNSSVDRYEGIRCVLADFGLLWL